MTVPPPIIDLDIRIFKNGAAYTVTAQTPDSGLAESRLDANALFDADFQAKLTQIREEPFTTHEALFRKIGETIFKALFRGQTMALFQGLWAQKVQSEEEAVVRLRLNIDEAAIELATLPWEMMQWRDVFLATQINTLLTRQVLNLDYGNIKSLTIQNQPGVLIVIPGGSGLDVAAEEKGIARALKRANVPFRILKGKVSLQMLDDALNEGDYAILHFIGHAVFKRDEKGALHGSLRFNSARQDAPPGEDEDWAPETDLQSLLGNYKNLKLVVLNACHTGEIGQRPGARGFWGVTPALLRAGIPAVVAMQYAIRDDVAALFSETFYKRLTAGPWAGHVDAAVTLARNACFLAQPDDRGFATPALYLRSRDGVIFHRADSPPASRAAVSLAHCHKAPKPPERLRYRYRNAAAEALLARLPLLARRLQRVAIYIDQLRAQSAGDEKILWQLQRYQKNRDALEQEMDELRDMLRWRAYESCLELAKLQEQVTRLKKEKTALEEEGAYISFELKNAIFNLNERILTLQALLQEIAAVTQEEA